MALRLGHPLRSRDLRLETLEDRCTPSVAGLPVSSLLTPVVATVDTTVSAVETTAVALVQQTATVVTAPVAATTDTLAGSAPAVNLTATSDATTVSTPVLQANTQVSGLLDLGVNLGGSPSAATTQTTALSVSLRTQSAEPVSLGVHVDLGSAVALVLGTEQTPSGDGSGGTGGETGGGNNGGGTGGGGNGGTSTGGAGGTVVIGPVQVGGGVILGPGTGGNTGGGTGGDAGGGTGDGTGGDTGGTTTPGSTTPGSTPFPGSTGPFGGPPGAGTQFTLTAAQTAFFVQRENERAAVTGEERLVDRPPTLIETRAVDGRQVAEFPALIETIRPDDGTGRDAPAPQGADLATAFAPFDLDALEGAVRSFLSLLKGGEETNAAIRSGLLPWLLAGTAVLSTAYVLVRQRRKALEQALMGAEGPGWLPGLSEPRDNRPV